MKDFYAVAGRSFGAMAGGFIVASLEEIMTWLMVMLSVVVCDLVTGVRCSILLDKKVCFSRAWRATMGKAVTYVSFVVMAVFIDQATAGAYGIDKWSVLFICFLEGCSIVSNLLMPKGYEVNFALAVSLFFRKALGLDPEWARRVLRHVDKQQEDSEKGDEPC